MNDDPKIPAVFEHALEGLRRGDFSLLDPLFQSIAGRPPQIVEWVEQGRFLGHDHELAEALTCACFNGRTEVAEHLLNLGIAPSGGAGTGLNAIHWAANRGQLSTVRLLLRHRVPLESRSMYEGTALGTAVWAAINEPRPDHFAIIEDLLAAGARVQESGYPTQSDRINALLRRHGAS
jgi:Ankyrin repeats (3 copies)